MSLAHKFATSRASHSTDTKSDQRLGAWHLLAHQGAITLEPAKIGRGRKTDRPAILAKLTEDDAQLLFGISAFDASNTRYSFMWRSASKHIDLIVAVISWRSVDYVCEKRRDRKVSRRQESQNRIRPSDRSHGRPSGILILADRPLNNRCFPLWP